jgi:hypothetical protein
MNRKRWQNRGEHPPVDILLLHLEGELEGRKADRVRLHVDQCAACRESCAQLERGISCFTVFRDSVAIPAPAPRTRMLRERLLAAQAGRRPSAVFERFRSLFLLNSSPRLAVVLGGASLCLIAWLVVFLNTPGQSVYASQILGDARQASDQLLAHSRVLNQKIRLRRGSLVIERSVHHGRPVPLQAADPGVDAQLLADLDHAHINLNDPLNANDFAQWRAGQREHTDSVKETTQDVTITTRVSGDAITEGTLTLSRSGWRPIARSVELRGEAPIEISEVSYGISDTTSLEPSSAANGTLPAAPGASAAAAPVVQVSPAELEIAEVDLREALHTMGADVSAAPQIWRSGNTVFFHAFPQVPGQRRAIEEAANQIPHVKEAEGASQPGAAAERPAPPAAPAVTNALLSRFGSEQAARAFFDSLRNRSAHVIAESAALDQLGKRYPVATLKAFSPDLQTRVNNLAASLLSSLQHDSAAYLQSLSPVLDAMAKEREIAPSGNNDRNLPGCLNWQENAALTAPELRSLDKNVSLLFASSQAAMPAGAGADQILSASLSTISFLERHLTSTCQLF